jgi:hypothetical protein
MARFLARHYYGERIARLFRHIRRLAPQTGRDPLLVLESSEARSIFDHAVLGSSDTAEDMLALIETYLLEDDVEIQRRFPYWRDLVRYQATMFWVESHRPGGSATPLPCRSASAEIVQFNWDIPAVIALLRSSSDKEFDRAMGHSTLLIASSSDRHVTSLRCTPQIHRLFRAADGTRTVEELGTIGECSVEDTEQVLRQMKEIGAIQWAAWVTMAG